MYSIKMSYSAEQKEAILELKSFMLNEVTEPAMTLIKRLFERSCPFVFNIEFAIHHGVFLIIMNPDNHSMEPFDEDVLWSFEKSCRGDILAFPINCFEDIPIVNPVREAPDGFGHANLVIVNRLLRSIEHFDPHGSKMNDLTSAQQKKFEQAVRGLFQKGPWRDYTYLPPRAVCSTDGVQNLLIDFGEEERVKSTCRIWCYHFLSERLANPNRSAAEINRANLQKIKSGPGNLGKRVEDFVINFILQLYKAINVTIEDINDQLCLQWPRQSMPKRYCVKKSKIARRRSGRR